MSIPPPQTPSPSLLKQTKETLQAGLFPLLLAQLPEASSDLMDKLLPTDGSDRLPWGLMVVFPYFCIASVLTSSLTFLLVLQNRGGVGRLSLGRAWNELKPRMAILVPVSLLLCIVILTGLIAAILPGLYFMALFFFVPQFLVIDPPLPWTAYLSRSKRLAKRFLWLMLTVVGVLFLANIMIYLGSETLAAQTTRLLGSDLGTAASVIGASVEVGVSAITGAIVTVWISHFFLKLKATMDMERQTL